MSVSTLPGDIDLPRVRRARTLRNLFSLALVAFLLLAVFNVFGVRHGTAEASGGGYTLTLRYPSVTRPGLASVWSVEIEHAGGFDGPVELATSSSFFDIFDENGLDPDPESATQDATRVIWEFEPPDEGDVLVVSFDARIEPAVQLKRLTTTTELLVDGEPVAAVTYKTLVLP